MTTNTATTVACPKCGDTSPVGLSDGTVLCLACRNEWDPADVPARAVAPPAAVVSDAVAVAVTVPGAHDVTATAYPQTADDILGPPPEVLAIEAAEAVLAELVGTDVILDGGQVARLVSFPDDDHAEVEIDHGDGTVRTETVAWSDVVRSIDTPAPVIDVPADTALALARVNAAVAGLTIRAGLASLDGTGADAVIVTPPTGWLPDDAGTIPAIEQGAAYAVAMLVHAFGLDRDVVAAVAVHLLTESQDQQPTKGGTE